MCSAGGAVGSDWPIVNGAADLGGDGVGDGSRVCAGVVHAPSGSVAVQAVGYVEVLFEVVCEGKVEEGTPVGGQLHARAQSALFDREVACGQVPVELVDVRSHFEPVGPGQGCGVDPRASDYHHP